jgi:hypothetical protein
MSACIAWTSERPMSGPVVGLERHDEHRLLSVGGQG